MSEPAFAKPSFPADAFAGPADDYVRFRVPYPARLLQDLMARAAVERNGRLLDLACGPGRLTLALAAAFREVWAIDLEPEMIAAARREAARRGVQPISWAVGRAEDLKAPAEGFELITIGEAFHRLEQPLVARLSRQWLQAGGCLAILGSYSIFSEREPWQKIVGEVVRKWARRDPARSGPAGSPQPSSDPDHYERVLRQAGFAEVGTHRCVETHDWTIATIAGFLYSTSVCSRKRLGAAAPAFEADLAAALLAFDPRSIYRESARWGYTLGRKPA